MTKTVTYSQLLDVSQTIRYNMPTSDSNGNTAFQFAVIITNIKSQGSDGSVRDTQTSTSVGGMQATAFTPQQIYTTVNGSTPGPLLATELQNNYNTAVGTAVS